MHATVYNFVKYTKRRKLVRHTERNIFLSKMELLPCIFKVLLKKSVRYFINITF